MKSGRQRYPGNRTADGGIFLCYATDRLKTPVTVMGLALQRMEEAQGKEERGGFLEVAKRGQQKSVQAVGKVLETARKERGGVDDETE